MAALPKSESDSDEEGGEPELEEEDEEELESEESGELFCLLPQLDPNVGKIKQCG